MSPGTYPAPLLPRFSIYERDRRWSRVRALMERDSFDVIIALHNSSSWDQGNGNGRYLSSIGGNCAGVSVVFPRESAVTVLVGPQPAPEYWLQCQDWVTDIRTGFFDLTPLAVDRLRELKLEQGRIGIAGLEGVAREPDGLVKLGAYRTLREQLPEATFVDATALLYEARFVKSAEEISMFEHSVALVEGAFDTLEREARPGVPESTVYARMIGSLLEGGSEPFALFLWTAGNPSPPLLAPMASQRPLGPDDVIQVELDAKWCGYLGHCALTHWIGKADATDRAMAELQYEAAALCCEAMRPGRTLGELVEVCAAVAAGTPFECKPIVHSRGTGLDAPVLVYRARDERTKNWVIEENSVFVVKPTVSTSDGRRKVMWGDTVVVTADGARRLGKRPAPLVQSASRISRFILSAGVAPSTLVA